MRTKIIHIVLAALLAALCIPSAFSQMMAKISGRVHDGPTPIVGATIELTNPDNARKYTLTTNEKGEFASIGIATGVYELKVTKGGQALIGPAKFGVVIEKDNVADIDIAAERARAGQQMSPEEKKRREELAKENEKITNINATLAQAAEQQKAGNYDAAVDLLRKAIAVDATKPLVWARLGDAELVAGRKTTDRSAAQEKIKASVESFNKALQGPPTGPGALKPVDVAVAYTNLAEGQARLGLDKDALASCGKIVASPEVNAGTCFFNVGAVLTNRGKIDDANTAFDKSIAADPARAESYYQKALNLMGKATIDKDGKTTAPPEVATNLNKYLQLSPNGPNAQTAKELLASLGAKVETSYGKKSGAKPVKK